MTAPIFFAPAELLAPLVPGSTFVLGGPEGRHAATVKRLGPGEAVDVVDGAGLRVRCTVLGAADGELELTVEAAGREPAPAVSVTLVQALAKGDRDELAIVTATELGVDAVVPWQSERAIVRWKAERAAKSLAKWQSVVAAAAKQARRAVVPEVSGLADTAALAAAAEGPGTVALVLHEDAEESIRSVLQRRLGPAAQRGAERIMVIVGPEGGISPREVERLSAAGASTVRLGPHVLRSSTAGPAAIAVISEYLGRWD